MIEIVLCGCGAWGRNLLRVLTQHPKARVVAVADPDPTALARARAIAPQARLVASLEQAIPLGADAVVVATPAESHAAVALLAMEAGHDVLVEKPLALTTADADRCVGRAASSGRVAMVGHLLRYHPTVCRMLELARTSIGEVRHLASARLSVGGDRSSSALWTLAPHDLSVLHALDEGGLSRMVAETHARGDRMILDARAGRTLTARIELSQSHATKERRMWIVGTSAVLSFDDIQDPERIWVGDAHHLANNHAGRSVLSSPMDDVSGWAKPISVPWCEPLAAEIDHFLTCIEERATPRTPFEEGAAVVRALAKAEASLDLLRSASACRAT